MIIWIALITAISTLSTEEVFATQKGDTEMVSLEQKKEQNILEIIHLTVLQPDVLDLMIPNHVTYFVESLCKDVDLEVASNAVKQHITSDAFLEQFIPSYSEAFSNEEIEKILNFYKSDESKKLNKVWKQTSTSIFTALSQTAREIVASFPDKKGKIIFKNEIANITSGNYQSEVSQSDLPVVLDAYSVLCGPCKAMEPVISNLSEMFQGRVKFGKVCVDEEFNLSQELKIQAMPTFLFIKDGKIIDRHVGVLSEKSLVEKIESKLLKP